MRDMSEECINAYYYRLSSNNEVELVMALRKMWWNTAYLAIFGPFLIPVSFLMGWILLAFPEAKPDISTLPNRREQPITSFW